MVVGAIAVLGGAAGAMVGWERRSTRREQVRREALAWIDPMARVEGCLFGTEAVPASPAQLPRHLRLVALGPDAGNGWPSRCLGLLGTAAGSVSSEHVARLRAALLVDDATTVSLRRNGTGGELGAWRPFWLALRDDVAERLQGTGIALRDASMADAPRPRATEPGDELPVSLAETATLAGVSSGDGVLSVMWVEPGRERVFCRTRDGGATIRCRRLPAPGAAGGVLSLIPSDRAEALVLVDQGATSYGVASADDATTPLFGLRGVPLQSLPLRARNDVIYAITQRGGRAQFEQVARGAPGLVAPLGSEVALDRESTLVAAGDPSMMWWVTSTATPTGLALDFRALGVQTAWRAPTPLTTPTVLLSSCHAGAISYVAVVDGAATRMLAIDVQGPREIGLTEASRGPARLACDESGVTVVGASSYQSCGLSGGCSPPVPAPGLRALARTAGSLVMVRAVGEFQAPRVVHRPLTAQDSDERDDLAVLSDDVRHGGLAVRAAWVFATGSRLLLMMSGDATVARWSDDHGLSWHASREADEAPVRLDSAAELMRQAHPR